MQPGFSLAPRDPFADAKQTLSSWDNCMAKDYCKWPVIVAIIVGGIIAFSVVFCIARCICCGAECCAICCCRCCCCSGGDSGHKRMNSAQQGYPPPQPYPQQVYPQQPYASPNPYAEARSFAPPPPPPPPPQISTQYQSHPQPTLARRPTNPNFNPQVNPLFARAASPEQPQFATFDAHSKPANEDALPEMPSWKNARSVQVEVEEEAVPEKRGDVEMDRLNHNGSVPSAALVGGVGAGVAGVAAAGMRRSPGPGRSPVSPLQGDDAYGYQDQFDRRGSPAQYQNVSPGYGANSPAYGTNNSPYAANPSPAYGARGPSPAQSHSQYSQTSDPYGQPSPNTRQPYTAPYADLAPQNPYTMQQDSYSAPQDPYAAPQDPYVAPVERYNSPAPPSYHTTAAPQQQNPYAYAPARSPPPAQSQGLYASTGAMGGYDPVPRSQASTPSAYPGQQTYQAFQPQGTGQSYGVMRKPVEGSARDI